jgi:hypothetical protein
MSISKLTLSSSSASLRLRWPRWAPTGNPQATSVSAFEFGMVEIYLTCLEPGEVSARIALQGGPWNTGLEMYHTS